MLHIGCHLSISKGFYEMGKTAIDIGANTFQFFTRNPRGAQAKNIDLQDVAKLTELMETNKFGKIVAHAPYTLNACSATERTRELAMMIMKDDLQRLEHLPCSLYNFHPGSHTGQGCEKGIELIAQALNNIIKPTQHTIVLLETMSGKGSEIGRNFLEIKKIMDKVKHQDKIGVCLDTCHIHDAGYDIVHHLDDVINEFDNIIGLEKLHAIHLNDSMNEKGSHKDRHQKIGEGYIGSNALLNIVNNKNFEKLPFILETPNNLQGYAKEIKFFRDHQNQLSSIQSH